MTRFFKTVTFLPEDRNNEVLVGRCIHILHGVCMNNEINDIGLSFPNWCIETVGERISFISKDKRNLEFLLNQQYFFQMERLGYFNISETHPVNTQPEDDVLFIRNQAIDNSFPGALRRDIKRAERRAFERGEEYTATYAPTHYEQEHYHTIAVSSGSKRTNFRLNIQMVKPNAPIDGEFTSYGLSNKSDTQCSVPVI
ncbi:type I-F CRISPR-associated endoribonuclease Cas6/Csy4 [Photobacterium sagamiensis]|uniref:type I-F CRISPR-associated endoribonuclease Cas6/Csy4 n=1 Tax=Photobacterium sagamiensis TaxID=2910241 RepID=UPI003D1315EF